MTEPTTLEEAVNARLGQQGGGDAPDHRLAFLAAGWKVDPAYERAIALRDSGPEGRAIVDQTYRGSWALAFYEEGKRAAAELERQKEQSR